MSFRTKGGGGGGDAGTSQFSSLPPKLQQKPRQGVRGGGGGQAGISDRRPRAPGAAQDAEASIAAAVAHGLVPPVTLDPDAFVDKLDAREPDYGAGVAAAANHSSDETGPRPFKLK